MICFQKETKMKKVIFAILCVCFVFVSSFSVFAADSDVEEKVENLVKSAPVVSEHDFQSEGNRSGSASYISSLHIGPNVNHSGPFREYTNDWFMIYFDDAYGMDFTYSSSLSYTVKLEERTDFWTYTVIAQQNAVFTSNYQDRACYMGECMAGRYLWNFQAPYASGIDCDTLYLISYNN